MPRPPSGKVRSTGRPTLKTNKSGQVDEDAIALLQKTPKTMVFRRGNVGEAVKQLIDDIRYVMSPNTAKRLKERARNTLMDFVKAAGPLHVSHLIMLSQTNLALYLRIARLPRGPTVSFRVLQYTTMPALRASQKNPAGYGTEYNHPPLVVLNNFNTEDDNLKITTAILQNMFPGFDLATIKLNNCRRVVLFHYDPETDTIQFRHYLISAVPVGLTRSVRKVVTGKIPSLHDKQDIADYLEDPNLSESESEINPDIRVSLAQNLRGRGNREDGASAIKLKELGPRMTLEVYKIQEGISDGNIIYNRYVTKTEEELAIMHAKKEYEAKLKEQRRQTQNDNILRKQREKLQLREQQIEQMKLKQAQKDQMGEGDDGSDIDDEDNEYDAGLGDEDDEGMEDGEDGSELDAGFDAHDGFDDEDDYYSD